MGMWLHIWERGKGISESSGPCCREGTPTGVGGGGGFKIGGTRRREMGRERREVMYSPEDPQ